jgi:ethanolamine utilization protein EutN
VGQGFSPASWQMQLAFVVGTLVATQKHRNFDASKLLLVQPIAPDETPRGPLLLAVDTVGAGVREKVLVVLDGKAAGDAMQRRGTPVDAAILGIVDRVDCDAALTQP